jgi:hypothetical protein
MGQEISVTRQILSVVVLVKSGFSFWGDYSGILASKQVFNVMVNRYDSFCEFCSGFWDLATTRFVKYLDFPALLC